MAKIAARPDFFKSKAEQTKPTALGAEQAKPAAPKAEQAKPAPAAEPAKAAAPAKAKAAPVAPNVPTGPVRLQEQVVQAVGSAAELLRQLEQPRLARQVEQAMETATKGRFTVAVVGEFSRGKSSFINAFLGQEVLPVGNLPTTALLTHIRWHKKPVVVHFDQNGKQSPTLPLTEQVWDDLVADNLTGNDPTGTVLVGLDNPWLKATNMELIDTPGAGDLEKSRAKRIGDALFGADGAIITVSALQAMSMSEKLFIEQRLISHKVPFLMLILTKLDQVPLKERPMVVSFVENKLKLWGMDIPVFIPYTVEMPDDRYRDRVGMDKVKKNILSWIRDPHRVELTQSWLLGRLSSLVETAQSALLEKRALLEGNEAERAAKLQKKQEALEQARQTWEELHDQMEQRGVNCYGWLREKADEYAAGITERLDYEVRMSGNPQKWWAESYPYRLKIELTNMATAVDNSVSKKVAEDAAWFNQRLEHQFKTRVLVNRETIADKSHISEVKTDGQVQFEDLDKAKNTARIGTTVLTVAGALLFSSMGALPLIATMGIGTGSSILTEKVFKDKVEKQRESVRQAIAVNVPELVLKSMDESERKLNSVYRDILREAERQEQLWLQAQQEVLEQSAQADPADLAENEERLARLEELSARLAAL